MENACSHIRYSNEGAECQHFYERKIAFIFSHHMLCFLVKSGVFEEKEIIGDHDAPNAWLANLAF